MNENKQDFTVSYCSNSSILVINASGKLRQVFTPFRVIANDANTTTRQVFIVDEVHSTQEDKLVYLINGKYYYHSFFTIEIHF